MKVNPIIRINNDYLSISFKNNVKKKIKLPYYDKNKEKQNEILDKINTLNIKKKQGMLFLVLLILYKRVCIIQGNIAVGKTHLIILFAVIQVQKKIIY